VHTLLGFLLAASPIAGVLAVVEACRRKHEPIMVMVYAGWALLAGVFLLVVAMRFWRLHWAGQAVDYIFETERAAHYSTIWGMLALGLAVVALALLRRKRLR
jgi:hypothetical protein